MNNPIAYLLIFFFFILFSCQTRSAYDISFAEMPFENAPLLSIKIKDINDLPYLILEADWEYVILQQNDNSLLGDLE
jgi:hypothetical protein